MAQPKQTKLPLEASNKPLKEFRSKNLRATCWKNQSANGSWYSVQIARAYKKSDGSWAETNQFNLDDLLLVSKLAELSYHFIAQQKT